MDERTAKRRSVVETAFDRGCDARTCILAGLACHAAQEGQSATEWREGMERSLTQRAWLSEALGTVERDLRAKRLWPWADDPSDKAPEG
jgi:hypothetical protein